MTKMFSLEVGQNEAISSCHCCGRSSQTGHGFVFANGTPYGVYYAAWCVEHMETGVSMAIALGKWEEDSTADERVCMGLEVFEGETRILFRFIEPNDSPWQKTDLLGKMISRKDALQHPLSVHVLAIGELIVHEHEAIAKFLHSKG